MGTMASTSSQEDVRMPQDLPAGSRQPAAVQGAAFWTRPLAFFERNRERYGGRFTVRLPMTPPLVVHTDPDHVKQISRRRVSVAVA